MPEKEPAGRRARHWPNRYRTFARVVSKLKPPNAEQTLDESVVMTEGMVNAEHRDAMGANAAIATSTVLLDQY